LHERFSENDTFTNLNFQFLDKMAPEEGTIRSTITLFLTNFPLKCWSDKDVIISKERTEEISLSSALPCLVKEVKAKQLPSNYLTGSFPRSEIKKVATEKINKLTKEIQGKD
jgi:hypothetical protein